MKTSTTLRLKSSERPKMSLLALIFFLLGSVDVYGRIQTLQQTSQTLSVSPLLKLVLLGITIASVLEMGHFLT